MSRIVLVFDEQKSRETGVLVLKDAEEREKAPAVFSDTIDPTMNHGDGEIYTSRSAMRAAERASGSESISAKEALEHRSARPTRGDFNDSRNVLRDAVEKAYYDRRDGRVPLPDVKTVSDVWKGGGGE